MSTYSIKHFTQLNSTNAYALEHFDELGMGDVVMTDIQTNGRGRFDRVWEGNSSDNIYMSLIIKPQNTLDFPYINLTQYLSVVLNRVFNDKYGIQSDIKWPNDILYDGKKFVGILSEVKTEKNDISGVVLGVGINVNAEREFFKNLPAATSMRLILNRLVDKNELTNIILEEFFSNFDNFQQNGFNGISEDYRKMCKFHSEKVKIGGSCMDGEYRFAGLNEDGTFSVFDENGTKIKVVSGDILC